AARSVEGRHVGDPELGNPGGSRRRATDDAHRLHPGLSLAAQHRLRDGVRLLAMTDDKTRLSGASIRRRVLGDSYVERMAKADPFLAPFFEAGTEHIWGGLWNRPGLDPKFRSLVVVSTLAATGHLHELQTHL